MLARKLFVALVALFLLGGCLVDHSPSLGGAQTNSSCCGGGSAVGLRELDFSYYSLREGFSSQLNLVSDSPHPIDLTIAIYSQRGNSVLATMSIQPNAKLPIDLRALLTQLGADANGEFGEGSIAVHFEGTIMPVVGQVTLTNLALRLVHESEMVENDPGRTDIPPILNGLWWNLAPGRDARIMVANMSVMTVAADCASWYYNPRNHPPCQCPADTSCTTSSTVTVQVPTSLRVVSVSVLPTGTSGDYGCTPSGDYGIKVKITYQVLDQNTRAIQSSLMEPQEEVTGFYINGVPQPNPTPNWADIGPTRISGTSQFTNPSGQFVDAPYGFCYPTVSFTSWTQAISTLVKGQRYTVRTNSISESSSSQGHGSITNNSDISKSR